MPTYTFHDKTNDLEYDAIMSYDDLESYLNNNPNIHQIFRMNLVDPVGIGISKPPSDFQKYVLGKVKAANPHADAIASKRWDIPKEI